MIGEDFRARDAEQRVTGTVPLVLDHRLPGMAYAKAVRCPFPHARIVAVHTGEARRQPGVLTVVTGADLEADPGIEPYYGAQRSDQPILAIDKARYAGDPVALVVAHTQRQADDAAAAVEVEYAEIPHVVDEMAAGEDGAPVVHDAWPDNECGSWRLSHGDIERGLSESEHVYRGVYHSPPASHVPMEPHVCVAEWVDDHLSVWSATQSPHAVRAGLERMFSLDPDRVRVRTLNLGGAYGAKGQIKIEPMTACASRAAGRPVRMELDREEVFQTIGKHAATVEISTGVTADGTILARRVHVTYNAGAYAVTTPGATGQALTRAPGPYRIPHCEVTVVGRYTNTVPTGPFRGAMTSQLAWAYESQLDEIATDLHIDPLVLRRRNLLRDGDEFPTGERMHDLHYDELLDDLRDAIDWGSPPPAAGSRAARGKGLAIALKNTLTPSRSEARLRLGPDGRIAVFCSSVEMGQGAGATMLQLAAAYLGVSPDRLDMGLPDTALTPFDTTTSSSRSTYSMGFALREAAGRLRAGIAELAAGQLGIDASKINHADGRVTIAESPGTGRSWARVLTDAGLTELSADGTFHSDFGLRFMDPHDVRGPVTVHWHQGAAAAEVEVDLDTGRVDVLRLHTNCYAGKAVSPLRVRQQNHGCAVFGLGPALFEELQYQDGTLVNPNLSDYMIPSIIDVPDDLSTTIVESGDPAADLHGVGEMALPAVAPAIANALFAATGVRVTRLPLTPERVLRALREREDQP